MSVFKEFIKANMWPWLFLLGMVIIFLIFDYSKTQNPDFLNEILYAIVLLAGIIGVRAIENIYLKAYPKWITTYRILLLSLIIAIAIYTAYFKEPNTSKWLWVIIFLILNIIWNRKIPKVEGS
ncbi:MAG: hypothetical protein IPP77_12010 [Bacteroidetes bacterium]|nr:hypothetical protein [Bacteroidota bacterium]